MPKQKIILISIFVLFLLLTFLLFFPIFNTTVFNIDFETIFGLKKTTSTQNIIKINLKEPLTPKVSDYFVININAKNIDGTNFPTGTGRILWKFKNSFEFKTENQQKFRIFIDGISHNYFVSVGEYRYWSNIENKNNSDIKIDYIKIELFDVDGIDISLNKISLKRKIIPISSYINYYFKNNYNIDYINRFLTPSYALLMVTFSFFIIYRLILRGNNKKIKFLKKLKPLSLIILLILVLFSFYYTSLKIFTVKSYWDSFKGHILSRNIDKTYLGFFDFRKFLFWLDEKIPDDSNIIVLIRGEPVYIMSEMAYNLYPRDIKFLNISGKKKAIILNDIKVINKNAENSYPYIVAISQKDRQEIDSLNLIYSYSKKGGFVFKYEPDFK